MVLKMKVSPREIFILTEIYENSFDNTFQIDGVYITFNRQDLDEIIDRVSDYFIKNGLDRKDEPTQFGLEIENLQEKFLNLLWSVET